jgi:hypothetical protein
MRKKGGTLNLIKVNIMETNLGLTELTENELKECNGGLFQSVLAFLLPSVKRITDFVEGYIEGYNRATVTP